VGLIRGAIPARVRNAVIAFFGSHLGLVFIRALIWQSAVERLDWDPGTPNWKGLTADVLIQADLLIGSIRSAPYGDWLDLMSVIVYYLRDDPEELVDDPARADQFRNRLNEAMARHHSAYMMEPNGMMVEPGSSASEAAIAQARAILSDPAMEGPDRQFQDAVLALTRRPNPGNEAAIAGAIGALEGVCRIALGDNRITLGDAIKDIARQQGLHAALTATIDRLYGYASDAGGRHGLVGKADADEAIAEFAVHQSAAAIVLVARLYGLAVV
jgi:hypothetical protein